MDVHVRFWSNEKSEVQTRYFNSLFMGYGTADIMTEHFDQSIARLE